MGHNDEPHGVSEERSSDTLDGTIPASTLENIDMGFYDYINDKFDIFANKIISSLLKFIFNLYFD